MTLTFNLSLLFYPFLPVTGPRYLFEKIQGKLSKGFFFRLAHLFVSRGSSKGTAFPSSHVSLSVIVLLYALRYDSTAFLDFTANVHRVDGWHCLRKIPLRD